LRTVSKIAAVAMVASLALAGCGKNNNDTGSNALTDVCKGSTGTGPKVGLAYDVGGVGDQSFNDAATVGMKKAIDELGASCISATPAGTTENDDQRAERLRTLADQGFNPVIGVGFIYSPAAAVVAAQYPDVQFAVVDGYSTFLTKSPLDNLTDLTFTEEQGSFLVGVAAALQTKAKHVGFVGGTHGDLIKKFEAGYVAGVHAVDPSIKIEVTYLTEDPNDGQTGFQNPAGGKVAAQGQLDKGVDVIYHAAGKSGLGVFEAVTAAGDGMWAIGVDSDQYLTVSDDEKSHILTSMIKRVDTAVFDDIKAFADGKPLAGYQVFDLAHDGVGYSTSGGFIDGYTSQIEEYAAKIKSGEIKVPTAP
jgi:basic membrane protein A and related proteins